ncbi:hypothetical protein Nepgr_012496 [Nepenthes gracilis]|uniref:Uncharacterized protein n=1 Tax=Nepenthes gracilis TaxID=150966 RepID=A0AAD3SFW7_NEPGR|nr:hypothetical protein Nepgr_012496 [Nepenthes gracilis]
MSAATSLNMVERAHQMYRDGHYDEALGIYNDALSMAKTKAHRIALHSNRAACYLKLHDFNKAADECTSVLELDHKHTGALMLRAQTLVTLKEYQCAMFDVNRLLELNPESEVYLNLQSRLKTQLLLAPIPESEAELEEDEDNNRDKKPARDDELRQVGGEKQKAELWGTSPSPTTPNNESFVLKEDGSKGLSENHSKGWVAIPKPKGHSKLDYSRWDRVVDDSSEDDTDDEDEDDKGTRPQYRFRVRTVDVQQVK